MYGIPRTIIRPLATQVVVITIALVSVAQQYDANLYSGLRWRMIGPFRAGRVNAVSG
jgi:hypothetical protein